MATEDELHDAARWNPIESDEWYAARDATSALRDVLTAAGMTRDFPYLRAELNAFGQGLIELGRVSPETAERLAELLRRAIQCGRNLTGADGAGNCKANGTPDVEVIE